MAMSGTSVKIWFAMSLGMSVVATGCGQRSGLDMEAVNGTVTYQGRPLQHGQVVFMPETGTPGPPGVGAIEKDGSFSIRTANKEGAAVGRHRVTVQCRRDKRPDEVGGMNVTEPIIPVRYMKVDSSPLFYEVQSNSGHVYEIDLTD